MLGGVDTGSSARLLPDISQCAEQQPFAGKGELLRRRRFWREGDADGWSGLDEHVKTAQLQVLTSMMATGGRGGGRWESGGQKRFVRWEPRSNFRGDGITQLAWHWQNHEIRWRWHLTRSVPLLLTSSHVQFHLAKTISRHPSLATRLRG